MKRADGAERAAVIAHKSDDGGQLSATERLRCLDMKEARRITGLSEATLYRLCASGDGPPRVRLSARRWAFQLGPLADWMAERAGGASASR